MPGTATLHDFGHDIAKGLPVNTYTGISDCYDLLMSSGYYDHDAMAHAAAAVIGERRQSVLELGVGTGMFVESLVKASPEFEITGVDFTPEMLDIAEKRIGDDAALIEADVTSMDLDRTFDAAISSGGVWVVIRDEGDVMLGTHMYDYDDELQGLQNVNRHLVPDGLLLLSIQDMHRDFSRELEDNIVYSQSVSRADDPVDEHFTIEKEYRFTRGEEVIAEQTLHLGFYRRGLMDEMLDLADFEQDGIDESGQFYVCRKAPVVESG